ncbi:TetR/AcrR family transcriptional regulator [Nocardioides jensenii]|uniref:TetR/AcrR family transcriptional regulator n=1 Tax=Nocardioides jensenii TaxID=1843 RepID=UPI0008368787|nr:TetR/AcrR family transcriptional regulator [Nocardioides jensenii]
MTQTAPRRRPYAARVPIEQRREQILDAAIAIIDRDGYDRVSIDAIAKEAGVTRPVVYGAYDGLGPLLIALLDRQQVRAMAQLLNALPEHADPGDLDQLIDGTVATMVQQLRDDPVTWRPILLTAHGAPDAVRTRIDADRELVRGQVARLIDEVLPDADSEVLAHAVLAVLEHFGRLVLEDPERFEVDRLVRAVHVVLDPLIRQG